MSACADTKRRDGKANLNLSEGNMKTPLGDWSESIRSQREMSACADT